MALPDLVVFSHLRWAFVYQRPQQLMSRLAGRWRVWFVEEPVRSSGPARLQYHEVSECLTVITPHTPVAAPGFHDDQLALLEPLLADFAAERRLEAATVWLYTPMALPLAKLMRPQTLVYDCMDELASFKDAPRQLRQRERALLKQAAVVFTGGPSLYEAKRHLHPNVFCVPSSVDERHFSASNLRADSPHAAAAKALQGTLPRPRLGFFGVIDERFDTRLLKALSQAHPEWQLVMVGPVVKIDPATLPQRPNIHWLGMQPYDRLPYLLAGWDICLMPFAMNEATRFISPTKTLEYMAGDKPIVSTPVNDVVQLYGHALRIADGTAAFIAACEQTWHEITHGGSRLAADGAMTVAAQSWDRSADTVHALIMAARAATSRPAPAIARVGSEANATPRLAVGGASA